MAERRRLTEGRTLLNHLEHSQRADHAGGSAAGDAVSGAGAAMGASGSAPSREMMDTQAHKHNLKSQSKARARQRYLEKNGYI